MADVTSWFVGQALRSGGADIQRRALLVTSDGDTYDLTHRVLGWPTIRQTANRFTATKVTLQIAATMDSTEDLNHLRFQFDTDSFMNAFHEGTRLKMEMGYIHPFSGPELVEMFNGRIEAFRWRKGTIGITARGADMRIEDMQLGSDYAPMYIGSHSNSASWISPASIAWIACASAGLDTTTSTANEDINWTKFHAWQQTFSDNTTYLQKYSACAAFTGQKVSAILAEIAKQTHSIMGVDMDGKLVVARRNKAVSATEVFTNQHILDLEFTIDRHTTVSRLTFMYKYLPDSGSWTAPPKDVYNSAIGFTYGYRHERFESPHFWYESASAAQFAAFQLIGYSSSTMPDSQKRFFPDARLTLPFMGTPLEITDSLRLVDSWANVSSGTEWYIVDKITDMQQGRVSFGLKERQEVRDPWADAGGGGGGM